MSDGEKHSRTPACTNCARRKTKCTRELPCSSCVASDLQCHYVQKRPEKKRRALHSSRYEESLTHISHQLEALSHTLQSVVDKNEASSQQGSSNDQLASGLSNIQSTGVTPQSSREDDSSFNPHSRVLADVLGLAVSSASASATDVHAPAVGTIQKLLEDSRLAKPFSSVESPSQSFSRYPELVNLSLPPMDLVLRVLAFAKTSPQRFFIDFAHTDEEDFANLCQKLYFPTQPFTIFAWINANCGLFYLFRDLDKSCYEQIQLTRRQVCDVTATCIKNIEEAIKVLRFCIDPSYEAVSALICATLVSMDCGNGFRAWNLVSAAARMSVDLGYHQLPLGYGDRQRSQKRKLFWFVYSVDKTLAFQFSRSPSIPDYDVITERPLPCEDFRSKWGPTFLQYIDYVKIQSDIYEQLLSARAQREPQAIHAQKIHDFAAKLLLLRNTLKTSLDQNAISGRTLPGDAIDSIDIGFSSILSMIYRALPPDDALSRHQTLPGQNGPPQLHPLCVESGRAALNNFVRRWCIFSEAQNEDTTQLFINWTLLFLPFMPFVAVFSNYIARNNQDDLSLLRDVVKIIETAFNVGNAVNKAHRAFRTLLSIAESWECVGESRGQKQVQNMPMPSTASLHTNSHFTTDPIQDLSASQEADISMMAAFTTDHPLTGQQDLDLPSQDWDMLFNEFDLGLGADAAREMMPWFEQNMTDSSLFN